MTSTEQIMVNQMLEAVKTVMDLKIELARAQGELTALRAENERLHAYNLQAAKKAEN